MIDTLYVNGPVDIHLLIKDVIQIILGYISEYTGGVELYERQYQMIERDVEKVFETHCHIPPILNLNFDEYQQKASTTAMYANNIDSTFQGLPSGARKLLCLSYVALGLGESGEVQGKIKKIIRDSNGTITSAVTDAISKELGDQLWYIAQMCNELDISLGAVAQLNLDKLFSRKERGVLQGSGDNR